jgi:hypothetical protein
VSVPGGGNAALRWRVLIFFSLTKLIVFADCKRTLHRLICSVFVYIIIASLRQLPPREMRRTVYPRPNTRRGAASLTKHLAGTNHLYCTALAAAAMRSVPHGINILTCCCFFHTYKVHAYATTKSLRAYKQYLLNTNSLQSSVLSSSEDLCRNILIIIYLPRFGVSVHRSNHIIGFNV